jgi:Ca2+-binding RTX toxin-like protein
MYTLPDYVENLTGTSALGQGIFANSLNNLIKMGAGNDLIVLHHGGVDTVQAGAGDDFVYFGDTFTTADSVDGGIGFDTVGLLGSYDLTFAANNLVGIEKIGLYSGGFVANHYKLVTIDANVAAGQALLVTAMGLSQGETLTFDGSAETNAMFIIYGGKGNDVLTGGAGRDTFYGNFGADILKGGTAKDTFEYRSVFDSYRDARDTILDFSLGDRIDLWAIDADNNAANGNSKFTFIGAGAFSNVAGQLRAVNSNGQWLVEADINGDALADMSILVTTTGGHMLSAADFIL